MSPPAPRVDIRLECPDRTVAEQLFAGLQGQLTLCASSDLLVCVDLPVGSCLLAARARDGQLETDPPWPGGARGMR